MQPPRLRDVADRAEVSMTTASIVLRRQPGIRVSRATQERVFRAAEELGYEPRRTFPYSRLVAVGAPEGDGGRGSVLLDHLVEAGAERGCLVVLLPARSRWPADVALPELAGVISLGPAPPAGGWPAATPSGAAVAVDLSGLAAVGGDLGAPVVGTDEEHAARHVAATLRLRGHRKVALVATGAESAAADRWRPALAEVLGRVPVSWTASGSTVRPELLAGGAPRPSAGDLPTAVVCLSSVAAAAATRGTRQHEPLAVPGAPVIVRDSEPRVGTQSDGVVGFPLPLTGIAAEAMDVLLGGGSRRDAGPRPVRTVRFDLDGFDVPPSAAHLPVRV